MSDRQLPDYNSLMIGSCEAIRGTRIERHITVRQLAFLVDIPEKEIYDIEMLKSSALTFWNYYALARRLGLPLDLEKASDIGEKMGRIDNVTIEFFDTEVVANASTFLPVKNHLPHDLAVKLKTKNQWLDLGFFPDSDATPYEMHPDLIAKRTYAYYHEDDVIDASGDKREWLEEHQAEVLDALTKSHGHASLNPRNLKY